MLILLNKVLELKWPKAVSICFNEIYSSNNQIGSPTIIISEVETLRHLAPAHGHEDTAPPVSHL